MSAMLSPDVYFRCSENSTENPWNGLACRPEMNPSMMNLARRSSRLTWRMTSGLRYFSCVPAKGVVLPAGAAWRGPVWSRLRSLEVDPRIAATAAVVLRDLGLLDLGE